MKFNFIFTVFFLFITNCSISQTKSEVIFVDGVQRLEGDTVPEGEHFVQVKCPKGDIQSFYTTFRKSIKLHFLKAIL